MTSPNPWNRSGASHRERILPNVKSAYVGPGRQKNNNRRKLGVRLQCFEDNTRAVWTRVFLLLFFGLHDCRRAPSGFVDGFFYVKCRHSHVGKKRGLENVTRTSIHIDVSNTITFE